MKRKKWKLDIILGMKEMKDKWKAVLGFIQFIHSQS